MNKELIARIRDKYEPIYGRRLSLTEVHEIGNNLANLVEKIVKARLKHEAVIKG